MATPKKAATPRKRATATAADSWVPKGAAAKLAYIQTHIGDPDKTGYNSFHKFAYIQEHSIIQLLRPFLRELHCLVLPSPALEVQVIESQTPKGKPTKVILVKGELAFIDTDEPPESPNRAIAAFYVAAGEDAPGDKAPAKAQTIFTKYAMQKMFLIPTEHIEDGDADERPMAEEEAVETIKRNFDAKEEVSLDQLGDLFDKSPWDDNQLTVALVGVGVEDVDDIPTAMHALTAEQRVALARRMREAME